MEPNTNQVRQKYGISLFSWVAHDYHPHQRGILWYIVFSIAFGGTAAWAFFADEHFGWITSFCILMVAAIYFWTHRNGNEDHEIIGFEKGILIDGRTFFNWDKFEGYWFVYDETVAVVNFEFKGGKGKKITLQLGSVTPEELRVPLKALMLAELPEKKESLLDLWIRALKL